MRKPKTCYALATEGGFMPAVPQLRLSGTLPQLPTCRRLKPDEKWEVFEVTQCWSADSRQVQLPLLVECKSKKVSDAVSENLIREIRLRHDPKLLSKLLGW